MNTIQITLKNGVIMEYDYILGKNPFRKKILSCVKHDLLYYENIEEKCKIKDILPILIKNKVWKNENMTIKIFKKNGV